MCCLRWVVPNRLSTAPSASALVGRRHKTRSNGQLGKSSEFPGACGANRAASNQQLDLANDGQKRYNLGVPGKGAWLTRSDLTTQTTPARNPPKRSGSRGHHTFRSLRPRRYTSPHLVKTSATESRLVAGIFSIPLERTGCDAKGFNPSASHPLRQYVAGTENYLLRVVADAFMKSSPTFNRLLLHGPTGTGKSHLLRGLLTRWKDAHPHQQVQFCSGRDFARRFSDPTDTLGSEKPDFVNCSWFILDNIEELVEYPRAQARLCVLLDERSRWNRPFVAVGRRHPTDLHLLSALSSRLSDGLVIPVQLPRTATRATLLHHMASHRKLSFDRAAARRLAESLSATYPRLLQ